MSGTRSWSLCSSVTMKPKRTSAPSPTCSLQSLVTWMTGNCKTQRFFLKLSELLLNNFSDIFVVIFVGWLFSMDESEFMRECEKNYSMWTFSGGFRTWVKMSLVRTSGRTNEGIEFRQEVIKSYKLTFTNKHWLENHSLCLFYPIF